MREKAVAYYKAKLISLTESKSNLSEHEFTKTSEEIENTIDKQTTKIVEKREMLTENPSLQANENRSILQALNMYSKYVFKYLEEASESHQKDVSKDESDIKYPKAKAKKRQHVVFSLNHGEHPVDKVLEIPEYQLTINERNVPITAGNLSQGPKCKVKQTQQNLVDNKVSNVDTAAEQDKDREIGAPSKQIEDRTSLIKEESKEPMLSEQEQQQGEINNRLQLKDKQADDEDLSESDTRNKLIEPKQQHVDRNEDDEETDIWSKEQAAISSKDSPEVTVERRKYEIDGNQIEVIACTNVSENVHNSMIDETKGKTEEIISPLPDKEITNITRETTGTPDEVKKQHSGIIEEKENYITKEVKRPETGNILAKATDPIVKNIVKKADDCKESNQSLTNINEVENVIAHNLPTAIVKIKNESEPEPEETKKVPEEEPANTPGKVTETTGELNNASLKMIDETEKDTENVTSKNTTNLDQVNENAFIIIPKDESKTIDDNVTEMIEDTAMLTENIPLVNTVIEDKPIKIEEKTIGVSKHKMTKMKANPNKKNLKEEEKHIKHGLKTIGPTDSIKQRPMTQKHEKLEQKQKFVNRDQKKDNQGSKLIKQVPEPTKKEMKPNKKLSKTVEQEQRSMNNGQNTAKHGSKVQKQEEKVVKRQKSVMHEMKPGTQKSKSLIQGQNLSKQFKNSVAQKKNPAKSKLEQRPIWHEHMETKQDAISNHHVKQIMATEDNRPKDIFLGEDNYQTGNKPQGEDRFEVDDRCKDKDKTEVEVKYEGKDKCKCEDKSESEDKPEGEGKSEIEDKSQVEDNSVVEDKSEDEDKYQSGEKSKGEDKPEDKLKGEDRSGIEDKVDESEMDSDNGFIGTEDGKRDLIEKELAEPVSDKINEIGSNIDDSEEDKVHEQTNISAQDTVEAAETVEDYLNNVEDDDQKNDPTDPTSSSQPAQDISDHVNDALTNESTDVEQEASICGGTTDNGDEYQIVCNEDTETTETGIYCMFYDYVQEPAHIR